MKKEFANEYLKVLSKYTLALIFAMFVKVIIIDITPVNKDTGLIAFNQDTKARLYYKEETTINGENEFNKPVFKDKFLNAYVEEYLEKNSCEYLDFNVFDMRDDKINLFLNCGVPDNILYDYNKGKELNMTDVVKDYDTFIENSKRLLALKYPKFLVEDIDFSSAVYNIESNEIEGHYSSSEYGIASYKINNNEIRDLMIYRMDYDDAYENESYTLDPTKKTIAFTFDDGPSNYDLKIIDALVDSHSSATFYVVGNRIENFPNSIQKMVDNNMEVGNHTYDHRSLTGLSDEKIKEQITKTNDIFYNMTGKNLASLRPSYGNINKKVRVQVGMPIVLWNIDTLDWKTRNAQKVYDVILESASDGDIVLMHSLYDTTLEAVEKVLPELYKRGFQVVSVGELAKLKGVALTSGNAIWSIK